MTEIYETQSERTDLPLVVMPSVLDSMIEPIKAQFPALHDVARVRMFEEFTSDEATIAERLKDADALLVGGYHISDDLLRTISGQGHVKCIVFCGTGVASYLNLDKARELKIRVCNAEHYGDHAVAEHTFALLFELIRRVGQLDKDVKAGNWAWASGDGLQLAGRRMGIIGLGGIGSTVAGIARALGMEVAAWNSHVPPEHFERSGATPVDDLNKLIETSDVISVHLPLNNATRGIVTAENLAHVKPGTLFINTARSEVITFLNEPADFFSAEHSLDLTLSRSISFLHLCAARLDGLFGVYLRGTGRSAASVPSGPSAKQDNDITRIGRLTDDCTSRSGA